MDISQVLFCILYHCELGGGSPGLQEAGRGQPGGGQDPNASSKVRDGLPWKMETQPKFDFYLIKGEKNGEQKREGGKPQT